MNAVTTTLIMATAWSLLMTTTVLAASGYRTVRTSGPLPVTVHVRAGGVMAGGPAANRTSAGGIVFPVPVASMTSTTTTAATSSPSSSNAAAAAAAGFTSFSTSSSASNHTAARNQTRSERLRARLVYRHHTIVTDNQYYNIPKIQIFFSMTSYFNFHFSMSIQF